MDVVLPTGMWSWEAVKAFCAKKTVNHLAIWAFYDVIFALIPFGVSVGVRVVLGTVSWDEVTKLAPEILFLALMLNATSMRDIHEIRKPFERDLIFRFLEFALMFGIVVSAIFFGFLAYNSVVDDSVVRAEKIRMALFRWNAGLAVASLVVCAIIQRLISRIED